MPVRHAEHEGLGLSVDLPHLKQRDVDAFYAAARAITPEWRKFTQPERASIFVKAAAALGWLPGWDAKAVDECDEPAKVQWLAIQLDAHVGGAITIPPNSKGPLPTT